jgi:hypothetical protein
MRVHFLFILIMISCATPKEKDQSTSGITEVEPEAKLSKDDLPNVDCKLDYYLMHDSVSKEAIEFWKGERKPTDDDATTKVFNELNSKPDEVRPFYFVLVSKLMDKTDGALADLAIHTTYRFVFEEHTQEFFSYTNKENCFINDHYFSYSNWAEHLGGALSMRCDTGENYDECISKYFVELKKKCPSCDVETLQLRLRGWL